MVDILNAEIVSEQDEIAIEDAIKVTDEQETGLAKYDGLAELVSGYKNTFDLLVPEGLIIENDTQKAYIRDVRIGINKVNTANKDRLRDIKKKLVADIDDATKTYNAHVAPILDKYYQNAAQAIAEYDQRDIDNKTNEMVTYLEELLKDTGIDFISLDNLGVSITASKTLNAIRKEVDTATNVIITNYNSIKMMADKERVLEYYKQTLDLNDAINKVQNENEIAERLAKQQAEQAKERELKAVREAEERVRRETEERVRAEMLAEQARLAEEARNKEDINVGAVVEPAIIEDKTVAVVGTTPSVDNKNQLNRYRLDILATSEDMNKVLELLQDLQIGIKSEIIKTPADIGDLF